LIVCIRDIVPMPRNYGVAKGHMHGKNSRGKITCGPSVGK